MLNPNDDQVWDVYRLNHGSIAGWTSVEREKVGEVSGTLGSVSEQVDGASVLFVPRAAPENGALRQNGVLGTVAAGVDLTSDSIAYEAEVSNGRIGQLRFTRAGSMQTAPDLKTGLYQYQLVLPGQVVTFQYGPVLNRRFAPVHVIIARRFIMWEGPETALREALLHSIALVPKAASPGSTGKKPHPIKIGALPTTFAPDLPILLAVPGQGFSPELT